MRDTTSTLLLRTTPNSNVPIERRQLPKHAKPTHYQLTFEPDLEKGTYQGIVHIDLEAIEDTSFISLNLTQMKVTRFFVVIPPKVVNRKDMLTVYDEKAQVFTIILRGYTIPAGTKFLVALEFEGSLDGGNSGFFRSSYVDPSSGELKWIASTQMEPVDARKAFPCFDEPALKATFRVTLIAEPHLTCLGNMDVAEEYTAYSKTSKIIKKVVVLNNTPPMSTYLVSFAVGELNHATTNDWRVPITIWAPPSENIENARFGLDISARVMKLHEEVFGVKYPLPKLDQISVPGHQGAMENWGLVNYGPGFLIYDAKKDGVVAKQTLVSVIAHELAHQWFGDIVTMQFWDGLWLNESFASWAQSYIQSKMFPQWNTQQEYLTSGYQSALTLDSNRASHPIQVPTNGTDEINQVFDDISYNKGESILKMLVGYIGIEDFLSGVRLYLKKHAYGNSVTADLWESLSEVCGSDVGSFMSTWTEKVGYPVLTVTEESSSEGEYIQVSQHRFLKSGNITPDEDETEWFIPISVRTKDGYQSEVLSNRTGSFSISHDFYKLNADSTGFYRVEYPSLRLILLAQAAKEGHLSVGDRIGIVSDATAFACSGSSTTPSTAVLSLFDSFSSGTNYFVWKQLLSSYQTILQAWKFHPDHSRLIAFQKKFTQSCLKRLCVDFSNSAKPDNVKLFQVLMFNAAGQADNEDVVSTAKSMFAEWMDGDEDAITADARDSILSIAIRRGGSKEFNYLLNLYNTSKTEPSSPKTLPPPTIFAALGHTQSQELIERLLNQFLQCTNQEIVYYFKTMQSMTTYKVGAELVWAFIKKHWTELLGRLNGIMSQKYRIVPFGLAGLGTTEHLADAKDFFYTQKKNTAPYDFTLKQALNTIETRANWAERDGESVSKWLEQEGF